MYTIYNLFTVAFWNVKGIHPNVDRGCPVCALPLSPLEHLGLYSRNNPLEPLDLYSRISPQKPLDLCSKKSGITHRVYTLA